MFCRISISEEEEEAVVSIRYNGEFIGRADSEHVVRAVHAGRADAVDAVLRLSDSVHAAEEDDEAADREARRFGAALRR